jgi:dATP/dGTP diphosphohydrolase
MATSRDAELQLARIREILRDPELYDANNSVTLRLMRDIKQAIGIPLDSTCVPEPESAQCAVIDAAHLERQRNFSVSIFGPGKRTDNLIDHIAKELDEIRDDPRDVSEWVDVIILAFDGAWRAGWEPQQIIDAIIAKQERNEQRTWPDWRAADPGKAIEHVRS